MINVVQLIYTVYFNATNQACEKLLAVADHHDVGDGVGELLLDVVLDGQRRDVFPARRDDQLLDAPADLDEAVAVHSAGERAEHLNSYSRIVEFRLCILGLTLAVFSLIYVNVFSRSELIVGSLWSFGHGQGKLKIQVKRFYIQI